MGKIHTRSEHTYTKLRRSVASWHGAAEGASEEEPRDAVCSLSTSPGRAHGPVGEKVPHSHTAIERTQSHHGLCGGPRTSLSTLCGDGGALDVSMLSLHTLTKHAPLERPQGAFTAGTPHGVGSSGSCTSGACCLDKPLRGGGIQETTPGGHHAAALTSEAKGSVF